MLVETASKARRRHVTGEERVFAAALAVIPLYCASVALRSSAGVVVDLSSRAAPSR
jgi:hypothetical protein